MNSSSRPPACAFACAADPRGLQMALRVSRRRCFPSRRAAAVAELAICLPLFVMLVLASIEACSMMFLDHGLTIASYEGVRVAINFDGNTAEAKARANEIINARSIK